MDEALNSMGVARKLTAVAAGGARLEKEALQAEEGQAAMLGIAAIESS